MVSATYWPLCYIDTLLSSRGLTWSFFCLPHKVHEFLSWSLCPILTITLKAWMSILYLSTVMAFLSVHVVFVWISLSNVFFHAFLCVQIIIIFVFFFYSTVLPPTICLLPSLFGFLTCFQSGCMSILSFFFHNLKMLVHTFDEANLESTSGEIEVWQRYPGFSRIADVGRKKTRREYCKF
jgi:hypothetical protein